MKLATEIEELYIFEKFKNLEECFCCVLLLNGDKHNKILVVGKSEARKKPKI